MAVFMITKANKLKRRSLVLGGSKSRGPRGDVGQELVDQVFTLAAASNISAAELARQMLQFALANMVQRDEES
jgi:hypothetical protein